MHGVFRAVTPETLAVGKSGEIFIARQSKVLEAVTLYHETTHFLQNRVAIAQRGNRFGDFFYDPIGFAHQDFVEMGLATVKNNGYKIPFHQIEAEAFSTEYDLGALESAVKKTEAITGRSFKAIPTYYLQSSILAQKIDIPIPLPSYYYSDISEVHDFEILTKDYYFVGASGRGFYAKGYASLDTSIQDVFHLKNIADVNRAIVQKGYVNERPFQDYPARFDKYKESVSSISRPVNPISSVIPISSPPKLSSNAFVQPASLGSSIGSVGKPVTGMTLDEINRRLIEIGKGSNSSAFSRYNASVPNPYVRGGFAPPRF